MKVLRWTLASFLETEGITAYALAQQLGGQTRQRAIYAITAQERHGEAAHPACLWSPRSCAPWKS